MPLPVSTTPATANEHQLANTTETSMVASQFKPLFTSTSAGVGFVKNSMSTSILTGFYWKISF